MHGLIMIAILGAIALVGTLAIFMSDHEANNPEGDNHNDH